MRAGSGLVIVALLIVSLPLFAANDDGSAIAVLDGGHTLIPIRAAAEWLGAEVGWEPQERTIIIESADRTVRLQPGSSTASINGRSIVLDSAPLTLAQITYVPARFVAEAFGTTVEFRQRSLTLKPPEGGDGMELRVAVLGDGWLTYRGPWFDIDYPVEFQPLGYDSAPESDSYDADGMSFGTPSGAIEFYVYSPRRSGEPGWTKLAPGESLMGSESFTEGTGRNRRETSFTDVAGPADSYVRSWVEVRLPEQDINYVLGVRHDGMTTYDRWHEHYLRFRNMFVQYDAPEGLEGPPDSDDLIPRPRPFRRG